VWGYGGFSSCDGQRWGVQQGSLHAALYPRYFGYYERAINVLTHISDQHSVFATRAIACGPREALYVLDGLLENDTVLKPREHTTDTHGITEQLFGLSYLLGISFMPRFRDIADVQLYRSIERGPTDRWTPSCGPSRPRSFTSSGTRSRESPRRFGTARRRRTSFSTGSWPTRRTGRRRR